MPGGEQADRALQRAGSRRDDEEERRGSGATCCALHAEKQWVIGTVAGELQPIVGQTRTAQRAREGRLLLGADGADGHLPHRRILLRDLSRHGRMIDLPRAPHRDDGRHAARHLGARLPHHQAAARRLPDQPDRRAALAGRRRRRPRRPRSCAPQYGLDRPAWEQYLDLARPHGRGRTACPACSRATGAGPSSIQRPVNEVVGGALGLTIVVNIATVLFIHIVAIPIAIYSATRQYRSATTWRRSSAISASPCRASCSP